MVTDADPTESLDTQKIRISRNEVMESEILAIWGVALHPQSENYCLAMSLLFLGFPLQLRRKFYAFRSCKNSSRQLAYHLASNSNLRKKNNGI